jgi:hypothetical protein
MKRNPRAATLGAALLITALADIETTSSSSSTRKLQATIAVAPLSGRPIPDAVIFAKRIDMGPEDMAAMTAPLEPLPSTEPGVYRFKTELTMAGNWALSLGAKVQGETGTVENKHILKATQ